MYQIGCAKADITVFKKDVAMLGYGMYYNVVKSIETPIYARAYVFDDGVNRVAFVNLEICFVTEYLKNGVIEKLQAEYPEMGFTDANVMLTAQHTHSAPGGITQHFFYNVVQPGFQQDVYEGYRDGVVKTIVEAFNNRRAAKAKLSRGEFAQDIDIAFNRSIKAYNKNPDIPRKVRKDEAHLAVDREMKLLRFESADESAAVFGSINWFGVHTTSISNDNTKICSDNKGYAADYLEQRLPNTLHAFAQDATGDVTPNYVWDKKKKWTRGPFEDDFESAKYHGNLQANKAEELLQLAGEDLVGDIDYALMYVDMSQVLCDEDFTNGLSARVTSPACIGMAFLRGTTEGPGSPAAFGFVLDSVFPLIRWYEKNISSLWKTPAEKVAINHKYRSQYPKTIVMEGGTGRIMTAKYAHRLIAPSWLDVTIKYMKYLGKVGVTNQTPWISTILPLQIFTIGQLAIVGIPAEITTIGGKRLRDMIADTLKEKGITQVILSPYANAYAGYITTNEEYRTQAYEGGHTLFGQWTLAAYQTKFRQLAQVLCRKEHTHTPNADLQPTIYQPEQIWRGFADERVRVRV